MKRNNKMPITMHQQRGVILIVALIMLLLLTMIGVAGMRDNQLQEKMTGATDDRATAFQAAEAALRAGEAEISAGTYGGCTASAVYTTASCYYTPANFPARNCPASSATACTETAWWQQYSWTTGSYSATYSGTGLTEVAAQPRYVIEKLPTSYSPLSGTTNGGSPLVVGSSTTINDYLITARGTGRTADAVVILQSMYRVKISN